MYSGFSADIQKSVDLPTSHRERFYDLWFKEYKSMNYLAVGIVLSKVDARPSLSGDHSLVVRGTEASIFIRKGSIMVS